MRKEFTNIRTICVIGLMAALVFVGTYVRIEIPAGLDGTMLHFGNVFCILSGLLFGGLPGGLAAGIGSAVFDLTGKYASEALITFVNKFAMGYVAGLVFHAALKSNNLRSRTILGAITGSLTYCLLYVCKTIVWQHWVYGLVWEAVWPIVYIKAVVTIVNGLVAVVVSVFFCMSLRPALVRSGLISLPDETDGPKGSAPDANP